MAATLCRIVSVNSYLIQDISRAMTPIRPDLEAGLWYFYHFLTERSRAGLTGSPCAPQVPNACHNLPQEAPDPFGGAILELAHLGSAAPH